MEMFGALVVLYLIGAYFISYICRGLSDIPLIEHRAYGIRNILCGIWLIIVVVMFIGAGLSKKGIIK